MGWDLINSFGTDEGFSGTSAEEVVGIHFGYDFKAFIYQHPFLFDDLMLVYLGTRYQWTKYEAKGEEYMRHRWKKQLPGLLRSIIMISGSVLHANRRNVIARVINTGAKQLLENWYLHDEMREELDGKGEEGQAA